GERHYQEGRGAAAAPLQGDYRSQWAEVAYFLRQTTDTANGMPLYALHRRQWLLVPDNGLLTNSTVTGATGGTLTSTPVIGTTANYPEMSCCQGTGAATQFIYFNNPRDVTMPARRMGMTTNNLAGTYAMQDPGNTTRNTYQTMAEQNPTYAGSDVMLTDVLSFEVRVLLSDGSAFENLYDIAGVRGLSTAGQNVINPRTNA